MPRRTCVDLGALSGILEQQDSVFSREQALACGFTDSVIHNRIKRGGPWQRLLPGTYFALTGPPTAEQRDLAALLYAGPASVITGRAALRAQGTFGELPPMIDVLIPADYRRQSKGFV